MSLHTGWWRPNSFQFTYGQQVRPASDWSIRELKIACEQAHVGAQARGEAVSAKSSGEALRRETRRDETFLAPLHQTLSRRIALLFAACACDSKVNLLADYGRIAIAFHADALELVTQSSSPANVVMVCVRLCLKARCDRIVQRAYSFS